MSNREKNFASAVLYVHNAEDCVEHLLQTVISVLETNFEHSEIICVNDGSSDASCARIKAAAAKAGEVSISILNMSGFHGLEQAMNAGVDLAIGDFVFEFDRAAMDYPPETIMEIYRKSLQGYDIVSASCARRERLGSRLFYRLFSRYSGLSQPMHTEALRVLSRRAINRIGSMNNSVLYRKAAYAACGLKTANLTYQPVPGQDRTGRDAAEKRYRFRLATDALVMFTDVGYRISTAMTVLMMILTVLAAVYAVCIYIAGSPVAGWTTTILFLALAFFGLFSVLSVIIKYLQLLVDLIYKRKKYSFESIEKLTK